MRGRWSFVAALACVAWLGCAEDAGPTAGAPAPDAGGRAPGAPADRGEPLVFGSCGEFIECEPGETVACERGVRTCDAMGCFGDCVVTEPEPPPPPPSPGDEVDADPCELPEDEDALCYAPGTACLRCEPGGDCDGQIHQSGPADNEYARNGPIGICEPGTECNHLVVNDTPGSQARMFCQPGATCDFNIGANAGRACARCEAGTECDTRCTVETDICSVDCRTSSSCRAACTNPTGSCVVQCNEECNVSCANDDACFVLCDDGSLATHCGGTRYVCNGGC